MGNLCFPTIRACASIETFADLYKHRRSLYNQYANIVVPIHKDDEPEDVGVQNHGISIPRLVMQYYYVFIFCLWFRTFV